MDISIYSGTFEVMKILVKENEAVIKMDVCNTLRKHKIDVFDHAEESFYDCIIIGESCYDLNYLKFNFGHLSNCILFIGSKHVISQIIREFPDHSVLHLEKPFSPESLLVAIYQLISIN